MLPRLEKSVLTKTPTFYLFSSINKHVRLRPMRLGALNGRRGVRRNRCSRTWECHETSPSTQVLGLTGVTHLFYQVVPSTLSDCHTPQTLSFTPDVVRCSGHAVGPPSMPTGTARVRDEPTVIISMHWVLTNMGSESPREQISFCGFLRPNCFIPRCLNPRIHDNIYI